MRVCTCACVSSCVCVWCEGKEDTLGGAEVEELGLEEVRVELDLVHGRNDLRVGQELLELLHGEVAHADRLGQALLLELLPNMSLLFGWS